MRSNPQRENHRILRSEDRSKTRLPTIPNDFPDCGRLDNATNNGQQGDRHRMDPHTKNLEDLDFAIDDICLISLPQTARYAVEKQQAGRRSVKDKNTGEHTENRGDLDPCPTTTDRNQYKWKKPERNSLLHLAGKHRHRNGRGCQSEHWNAKASFRYF